MEKVNSKNGMVLWTLNSTASTLAHDSDFFVSSDVVLDNNNIFFSTSTSLYSYNLETTIKWAEELTGINSVKPWINASIKDSK